MKPLFAPVPRVFSQSLPPRLSDKALLSIWGGFSTAFIRAHARSLTRKRTEDPVAVEAIERVLRLREEAERSAA